MSSSQGDSQGWSRHWEVLDRVGLPDYTPDVLWQADVLQRAGVQPRRPLSSASERRNVPAGSSGSGAAGANSRAPQGGLGGPGRPATASGPSATSAGGRGAGGGLSLHPRLRAGLAKQPSNRTRQPRLPLEAALNLQLVEEADLYGTVPYQQYPGAQALAQEWSATAYPAALEQQEQQKPPALQVPRLELSSAGLSGSISTGINGNGSNGGLEGAGGSSQSNGTLPSLAQTPTGGGGGGGGAQGLTAVAAAAAAASSSVAQVEAAAGANGSGDALGRGNVSVVSFRIPLPAVPQTPTARGSSAAAASTGLAAAGAHPAAAPPLRKGSDRAGGGGGVTWSDAAERGLDSDGFEGAEHERAPPPPPHHHQHSQQQPGSGWRPTAGAGGSGDLPGSARLPPSRKSSAGLSYTSYQPSYVQLPYHPSQQQQQWSLQQQHAGKSLSGEASSMPRFGTTGTAPGAGTAGTAMATPRQRYKGILERVGRAAAHKVQERRRAGALASAAGVHLRWRDLEASESDAGADSDGADGSLGGSGGGSGPASPAGYGGGLARWGSRYYKPLAALNEELAGAAREDVLPVAATSISGEPSSAAALAPAGEPSRAAPAAAPAPGSDPGQQAAPASEDSQGPASPGGAAAGGAESRGEAAARRLGVAERAVWQLRRALDELSRFSCAHAVRRGEVEESSVLAQVDARIQALRRYDRVELGPDGRRTSIIPPPPPPFPLEAAREYLASAQSGVAGLEQLEEAVASMRRKLQIVVGQDTEDLRKAAAEALADAGLDGAAAIGGAAAAAGALDPSSRTPSDTVSGQAPPYIVRRPSSGLTLGGGASYSAPSTYRLPSAATTVSGYDPAAVAAAAAAAPPSGSTSYRSPPSSPYPSHTGGSPLPPPLASSSRPWTANRRSANGAAGGGGGATTVTERIGAQRPSGPGLDPVWAQFESLVILLHDSHASRVEMMDAFDARPTTAGGDPGSGVRGGAAAALLAAAAGATHARGGAGARRRGGGLDRLARLVEVLDESGAAAGMAQAKEAATEAAVNANAVRAAVAATLEPKHTEQALYFLAQLALTLQQDPRLPPDAGFLLAAGLDLLLGEVHWLLALLRSSSGAGSPHLTALAAVLRAYEMQRSYTLTLRAVSERLELAAEEALDKSTLLERQLSAAHSALQKAGHQITDAEQTVRELERDMKKLKGKNDLLQETIADLEGDMERVEAAHEGREATLAQAEKLAGALREEQLLRVRARSRAVQVASEGTCSDPRAIPPILQPDADQYYPISPCVSHQDIHRRSTSVGRRGSASAVAASASAGSSSLSRSGTKKILRKTHTPRKGGVSRAGSRRGHRGSSGTVPGGSDGGAAGGGAAVATAAAASLAAVRAAAEVSDEEDDGDAAARHGDGGRAHEGGGSRVAALRRGAGMRAVSWVDRTPPGRGSPELHRTSGPVDGRISPVVDAAATLTTTTATTGHGAATAGAAAWEQQSQSQRRSGGLAGAEEGGRELSRSPGGSAGAMGGARQQQQQDRGGLRDRSSSRSPSPTSGRPRSARGGRSQSRNRAPPGGQQQQQQPLIEPHQMHLHELELQQQQQSQQQQLLLLRGVDGVEYWAPAGGGSGSGASGDGAAAAEGRGPAAVLRDPALEQAARDMFSDVFVRQTSGGPRG